jgi:hypothetical protein
MQPRAVLQLALASALLACSRSSPRGEPIGKRAWIDTVPSASSSSSARPSDLGVLAPPSASDWSTAPAIAPDELRAIGCRARVIAPWVRLSCGKNELGGAPSAMIVTNVVEHLSSHRVVEKGAEELATTIPYDVDVPLELVVFWNDAPGSGSSRRGRAVSFRWAEGASKPPTVQVGPPEPMVGARLCACTIASDASSCHDETKLDCERSYPNDCAALMDCVRGRKEASGALVHPAKCLPGYAPGEGGSCTRP